MVNRIRDSVELDSDSFLTVRLHFGLCARPHIKCSHTAHRSHKFREIDGTYGTCEIAVGATDSSGQSHWGMQTDSGKHAAAETNVRMLLTIC